MSGQKKDLEKKWEVQVCGEEEETGEIPVVEIWGGQNNEREVNSAKC